MWRGHGTRPGLGGPGGGAHIAKPRPALASGGPPSHLRNKRGKGQILLLKNEKLWKLYRIMRKNHH